MKRIISSLQSSNPNLKNLEPDIKQYIRNLEKENLKLHAEIIKLNVLNLTKTNKIKAMEKEIVKLNKNKGGVVVYLPWNDSGPATHQQLKDGTFKEIKK